jgi:hypothetical protein
VELATYRAEAEEFTSAIDREYLLHYSGRKHEFDLDPIYGRHAGLFEPSAVEELRAAGAPRELVRFAAEGHIGREVKGEISELARREAAGVVRVDGDELPFRQSAVAQADEPDADRRAAIESARLELTARELNPLLQEAHERAADTARSLGFRSMRALCEELGGLDLDRLGAQAGAFLAGTEELYAPLLEPELRRQLDLSLAALRRSDVPAFVRAPSLDGAFPSGRALEALETTLAGLGVERGSVQVDSDSRPTKSPRAFCAPVLVPDEVHLVFPAVGGREDFDALFHEAGHAWHYANVDRNLPVEARYLGDNSVTEGFAFLMEHLLSDATWLQRILGVDDPNPLIRYSQALRLLFLRRYCAKLLYEIELHGGGLGPDTASETYARRLSAALRIDWPRETWLADVDPFFYAARYLRAWAFESRLRRHLRDRFGPAWFAEHSVGAYLRGLWRQGQARDADELLAETCGERIELAALLDDVRPDDQAI